MTYDLHCHSFFSDGDHSPSEVVQLAQDSGVTHLALTDHDTLDGLPDAADAAAKAGIQLINGIELSCTWEKQLVHVVGLNVDPNAPALLAAVENNKERRQRRAQAMFADLEHHNIDVRDAVTELIGDQGVATRPHFADALVAAGYAKDKKQAFKRFLVRGKPGYIPMKWPDLHEVGQAIVQAGGEAILAHPMRYKLTRTKLIWLIKDMLEAGVRGIEVCTASTDKQQVSMLAELTLKFDLLGSIGSDFHSLQQPWAKIGRVESLPNTVTPVWESFK